ncbi:hypothetical protein TRP8649_00463 [Pelagimonas phthalicica]|uniref:Methyltransferase domain-containing protein n=1 Tax=Pelagimonas phthalicica TaxID=1037362 RepID=A0A238J6U3_9RHOB|nr:class I SAM-dependent methyltransferase [Pelagimonas phthalicica]TDS95088.1 methyltransferase family protein [Pelagimonas phthalicica]SMX26388.1 hypothetical protein TRP8649_00463 [Pelagimonas phthalicica]
MQLAEIEELHAEHLRPRYGTTTPDELNYIQKLIIRHKPKRFIEIGTASGLSTGFIARFMEENGGESVTSIDYSAKFFGQADKPVGFLAPKIYPSGPVQVDIIPRKSALDLQEMGGEWDMAFIDANHQHPWPIVDTLAVAPHMRGSKVVIHHDLQLYRRFKELRGIGPRVLFNEMPDSHRHADIAGGWNIFSVDLNLDKALLEEVAIGALSMPWTSFPSLTPTEVRKFEAILAAYYSSNLLNEFRLCQKLFRHSMPRRALFSLRRFLAESAEKAGVRQR